MVQLLSDDSLPTSLQPDNFDELKVNPILKKLAPEKQAIALEELVHLLKADQLALILDEQSQQLQEEEELDEESAVEKEKESEIESTKQPEND